MKTSIPISIFAMLIFSESNSDESITLKSAHMAGQSVSGFLIGAPIAYLGAQVLISSSGCDKKSFECIGPGVIGLGAGYIIGNYLEAISKFIVWCKLLILDHLRLVKYV